jgi:hypothetical protein
VSDIDIAVAVSLNALDLDGRLEKRTCLKPCGLSANDSSARVFGRTWPDCRMLLAAAAGAGLATSFNAPIGAAVFRV